MTELESELERLIQDAPPNPHLPHRNRPALAYSSVRAIGRGMAKCDWHREGTGRAAEAGGEGRRVSPPRDGTVQKGLSEEATFHLRPERVKGIFIYGANTREGFLRQ